LHGLRKKNIKKRIRGGQDLLITALTGCTYSFKIGKGAKTVSYEKFDTKVDCFDTKFPLENATAKKIMSTLWVEQNKYDSTYNIRWTFKIGNNRDYEAVINKLH
jgi:hypothetical protein